MDNHIRALEQIRNFPSTLLTNRGMFPLRSGREVMRRQERPLPLVAHEMIPMRTYLITYDLASSARHSLSGAIMQLGEAWARPLDATWYVQSSERAEALERRLKPHLDGEDGLLIQQVEANALLLNTALRWFRKRRQETGAEADNVVAFPVAQLPEAKAA